MLVVYTLLNWPMGLHKTVVITVFVLFLSRYSWLKLLQLMRRYMS